MFGVCLLWFVCWVQYSTSYWMSARVLFVWRPYQPPQSHCLLLKVVRSIKMLTEAADNKWTTNSVNGIHREWFTDHRIINSRRNVTPIVIRMIIMIINGLLIEGMERNMVIFIHRRICDFGNPPVHHWTMLWSPSEVWIRIYSMANTNWKNYVSPTQSRYGTFQSDGIYLYMLCIFTQVIIVIIINWTSY